MRRKEDEEKRRCLTEVREFVSAHEDDDNIDSDDLERVFRLAYGRSADRQDRADGLWSLICVQVKGGS